VEIPSWLYLPPGPEPAKHPALVWLHGGWLGSGSMSNEFDRSIRYFVDHGFVVLAPTTEAALVLKTDWRDSSKGMTSCRTLSPGLIT